jgi:flagellar biosynthesis anti-sigma factor FlgM
MNIQFGATNNQMIMDPTLSQGSGANRTSGSQKTSPGDAAVVSLGAIADEGTEAGSMSDVSGDRVQQLRAMIEQGTYTVNPTNVANAMFATLFGES